MAPADEQITGSSDVPPGYEEFLSWEREAKTNVVRTHPGNTDLPPAVRIWGSTPFRFEVTALIDEMDRDKALWAASLLCGLVGAEGVTMASDAFASLDDGGRPPAARWAAGDRTTVSECLMFHTVFSDGRQRAEHSLYEINDDGGLTWGKNGVYFKIVGGVVPDALSDALTNRPAFMQQLADLFTAMGFPPEQALVHRIAVAVEKLMESGIICVVAGDHPFLEERLTAVKGARVLDVPGDPLDQMLRD